MDADPYAYTTSDLQPTLSDHFRRDFDGGGDFGHQFVGDFYREPDDTCRGLTLGLQEFHDFPTNLGYDFETFGQDPYNYKLTGTLQGDTSFDKKQTYEAAAAASSAEQPLEFVEGFEVPLVPDDPYFNLSPTTLYVSPTSGRLLPTPAQIGNLLIDFLKTDVNSSIEKVRPRKFWIRANVFLKSEAHGVRYSMCTIKIRIYKALDGSFVIEFMRRTGDALVFNKVFQQASRYLKNHVKIMGDDGDITPPPSFMGMQIPFFLAKRDEAMMLGPVLEMAATVSQPSLQAEAAAALAEGLSDQDGQLDKDLVDSLCTEQVFQAVRHLIRATDMGVLFPLARFLLQLISSAQADDFLSKDGLLEDILSKTLGMDTCAVVASEMSQVLAISIPRCAQSLPQEAAASLRKQLSTAAAVATINEVQANLRAAARALV
jgi:hypothetical protein